MKPEASEPAHVLELENVDLPSAFDPENVIVRGVQWRVAAGDRWLVVGPPGSGKSTVLNVAAGLVRPIGGSHRLFGVEVFGLSERQKVELRSRVGVVFGNGGRLFSPFTVAENLLLPMLYHGRNTEEGARREVEALLEKLGLSAYARRRPRHLSRRTAQRVALARALTLAPEVLMLDDPVGGLAPDDVEWWLEYFDAAAAQGSPHTLILASSDPRPWIGRATHYASIEDGRWEILDGATMRERWLRPGRDHG